MKHFCMKLDILSTEMFTNKIAFSISPQTGYSYGFAFVNFMNDEAAIRAIKCLNGKQQRDNMLECRN